MAADRLRAQLMKEPSTWIDALEYPAGAPGLSNVFARSGYRHRILRYELYNQQGSLVFTSGRAGLNLSDETPNGIAAALLTTPEVTLGHAPHGTWPTHYAVLALPIRLGDQLRGVLVAFLDQSDQASVLSDYFGLIAAITMLLLGAGIAVPIGLAWLRGQERRQAEAQVRYLESHDVLTGLPNRRVFSERLTDALKHLQRDQAHIAVLCLDVDKFQEINESADHAVGDAVLRAISARIRTTLREGDLVARLAGDEFAVALVSITNLGEVKTFMNRLVEALRAPFKAAEKEIVCTASVGIAFAPVDGDDAATLLRHADIALARAKDDGGQRMCFFESGIDKALQRRRMVERELRIALSRDEFEVVYQPEYDLATGTQCAAEALVRWHHPVHGKIAPAHFIAVAEDTGLIVPLGEWVLRRACGDAVNWEEPLTVAVNLSPAQFRDGDVAETVAEILRDTGLPPQRLELEITENLLINDTEEVLGKLNRLHELGVSIAMDDFGTGYSSLSYLARFPFGKIKIDRSFVRSMTTDPAVNAIVKTIIALGRLLDITITAEGVETQEQAALLREYGCPQAQGFLYGYPTTMEIGAKRSAKVTGLAKRSSAA